MVHEASLSLPQIISATQLFENCSVPISECGEVRMDRRPHYIYVLTQLFINPEGEIASKNVAVTFDLFEAEAHRASAVENDFERYTVAADWCELAEQSSLVTCMREFRRMVQELQDAALR